MFTNDIVLPLSGRERFTDRQIVWLGRSFIVLVVALTYLLSLFPPPHVFDLAVWCFSGFASLFPVVFASIYWRRVTRTGVIGSVLAMAVTWCVLFYHDIISPSPEHAAEGGDYLVWGMMPVAVIFAVSTIALILISLVTTPPSAATVERFVPRGLYRER
jgi:SSS family solute:Na+ symporter